MFATHSHNSTPLAAASTIDHRDAARWREVYAAWGRVLCAASVLLTALSGPAHAAPLDVEPPNVADVDPASDLEQAYRAVPTDAGALSLAALTDNVTSWRYRWDLLESTTKTLDVTSFIIENDVFGLAFLGKVLELARRGVEVRLLMESRGTAVVAPSMLMGQYIEQLVATGHVRVRWAGPLLPRAWMALTRFDMNPLLASNHDKLIISDGARTLFGGRNIGRDYMVDVRDVSWVFSDIDFALEGETGSAAMKAAFDAEWERAEAHRPLHAAAVVSTFGALRPIAEGMGRVLNAPALSASDAHRLRNDASFRAARVKTLEAEIDRRAPSPLPPPVRLQTRRALDELFHYPLIFGAPKPELRRFPVSARVLDSLTRPQRQVRDDANEHIIALAKAARHDIVLLNPYVVLTERGLDVLRDISARGVKITILTNSPASSDSSTTQALFLRMWPEILAAAPTARLYVLNGWRPLHGKMAIIDEEYTLAGSYNLDYVSAFNNGEVGLVVRSKAFAREMKSHVLGRIDRGQPPAVEYQILRDDKGRVVRGRRGKPTVLFGPDDHCDALSLQRLRMIQVFLDTLPGIFTVPLM